MLLKFLLFFLIGLKLNLNEPHTLDIQSKSIYLLHQNCQLYVVNIYDVFIFYVLLKRILI